MIRLIKKYYVVLVIIVAVSSYLLYQSIGLIVNYDTINNNPLFNGFIDGKTPVSIFMGSVGDKSKCDTMIQVKRGVQSGDLIDKAIKKLFEGPLYSEELVISSAYKGYDKIYNGTKINGSTVFLDFKYDLIDPNSTYYKDFTKTCSVSQLNQLIFTAKQFKEIQNVVIAIDGSPKKFMQSRQVNCDIEANQARFENECLTNIP